MDEPEVSKPSEDPVSLELAGGKGVLIRDRSSTPLPPFRRRPKSYLKQLDS